MKMSIKIGVFLLVFICSLVFVVPLLHAQKIIIKTEKGIPVVYNPKNPAPPTGIKHKLILEEQLCIGDDEEEYLFDDEVSSIATAIDKDLNIFTLDRKQVEIRKFSADGQLIKIFGKKGSGPGEIQLPSYMMISPQNELVINDRGNSRMNIYSLNGEFLRYIPTQQLRLGKFMFDSKGNIVTDVTDYSRSDEKVTRVSYELCRFNQELEKLFTIFSLDTTDEFKDLVERRKYDFGPNRYWQLTKDDRIILGDTKKYEFLVINPDGNIIKKIKKEFDPLPVPKEDLDKLSERTKQMYEIASHYKGFYYFTIDDEGRIFARTWEKTDDKKGYYYDVFDPDGRYIAKIPIKAFVKRWMGGRLLTAEETEDGFNVVKLYKVIWEE